MYACISKVEFQVDEDKYLTDVLTCIELIVTQTVNNNVHCRLTNTLLPDGQLLLLSKTK